jgi:hypothetical protein
VCEEKVKKGRNCVLGCDDLLVYAHSRQQTEDRRQQTTGSRKEKEIRPES